MDLQSHRERLHLTQEELAEKSGISVRTIQRIEAGTEPKGHTRKALFEALGLDDNPAPKATPEAVPESAPAEVLNKTLIKVINVSSLPLAFVPLGSAIPPLIIMLVKQQFDSIAKRILTVQILWAVFAVVVFFTSATIRKSFGFSSQFTFITMVILVLINLFIIIRNAAEIDKKGTLYIQPPFSFF